MPDNWRKKLNGKNKVMEPSVAVEPGKDIGKCDAVVNVIIMDGDTTSIAKLIN